MKLSGTVFFQQIFLSLAVEALSWPGQYERDWWWRGGGFGRLWFWLVWWVTINYSPVQPGWWSAKDPNSIRITLHVQYEFGQYESVIYDKAVVAFSRWPSTNHLSDQSGEPQPSVEYKPIYKLNRNKIYSPEKFVTTGYYTTSHLNKQMEKSVSRS